jgi:tRNA (adenine22-N1)-methyltransferase
MLKNQLCEQAVITDISKKSLAKAESLLEVYMQSGKCKSVCCDGLLGVDSNVEQVLIAGMGGEEIVKILKQSFIPRHFVFQPMKNVPLLRSYLLDNNCKITQDDIFKDGKFYFIIKGQSGSSPAQEYTTAQKIFGKDSLSNAVFKEYLDVEIAKIEGYLLSDMTDENRQIVLNKLNFLKGVKSHDIT